VTEVRELVDGGGGIGRTDSRGSRVVKDQTHSARRVDLAVAAIMAHSRAVELARRPVPSIYVG